jgi:hypothetical protein
MWDVGMNSAEGEVKLRGGGISVLHNINGR